MEGAIQLSGCENDEIEEEVNCLFEDLRIEKSHADCFEVARLLGIELIKYSEVHKDDWKFMTTKYNDGFSVMKSKSKYMIFYNAQLPANIVQFTIWYEIGHIQLGHLYENQGKSSEQMQAECNCFAVHAQRTMPFMQKLYNLSELKEVV